MADTLPAHYYYFFWLFETSSTLAGAAYAVFRPQVYAEDMLPAGVEVATDALGATIRGRLIVGGLGNCFLVLALISLSLIPVFKSIKDVELQEKLFTRLLIPLAIADFTHILVTLIPLPRDVLLNPVSWTQLIHGNVDITAFLLFVRILWLTGVARPTAKSLVAAPPKVRRSGRTRKSE